MQTLTKLHAKKIATSLIAASFLGCGATENASSNRPTISAMTSSMTKEGVITTSVTKDGVTTTTTSGGSSSSFAVQDTGQTECYSSSGSSTSYTNAGQDASYTSKTPSFTNNGNKTITDNISSLMWTKTADTNGDGSINSSDKKSQSAAQSYCSDLTLGGYSDWRLPDIKTMYSLINFNGKDPSGDESVLKPFLDTTVFDFAYGDTSAGERTIDAQWATSTTYVSTTMNGDATMFGVNLADGRIKGYPINNKTYYVYCVRGNETYGVNSFTDNSNGTISDKATGLMWQQADSGATMEWQAAIDSCEGATTAGYSDWRLPNAKELQSILDYTRSPNTTSSAAINALFSATSFTNEAGQTDWGFYWSSTTHVSPSSGASAVYVSFGRALGYMNGSWLDVHGAGAQRSDPKAYPTNTTQYTKVTTGAGATALTHGPQGDVIRAKNYVRCVRN